LLEELSVEVVNNIVARSKDGSFIKIGLRIKLGTQSVVDMVSKLLKRIAIDDVLGGPIYYIISASRLANS
jgi:hypothetical protein